MPKAYVMIHLEVTNEEEFASGYRFSEQLLPPQGSYGIC